MTEAATRPGPGTPCWASLMVHDLTASQRFYAALFDWRYEPGPQRRLGPYVQAERDGVPVAGLGEMASGMGQRLVSWLPYLATEDADATATLIRDCGGTVAVGPLDVEPSGRLVIAADPLGAVFGVWQAGTHLGVPFRNAPGAPVWAELVTMDAATVGKFYSMVFGYEWQPEPALPPESDYLTIQLAGRPIVGIEGVGDAVPHDRGPYWLTHFSVTDVDASAQRVTELGGALRHPPQDTPFGRVAQVSDPEGAPFALIRPLEATDRNG